MPPAAESLAELQALAQSAGAEVLGRVVQSRPDPEAATLIGSGKLRELEDVAAALDANAVLFDHELTPTQQRNLERALRRKVVDRTQLILDIFAKRARTREGQLQVELAQLTYLLPRLTGRGIEMSRLGGGIGTRGPGETQLETDRRRIFRRIRKLKEELEGVRSHRAVQRRQRQAAPLATAALVGYTNAGKSTLFNKVTGAAVTADARLFATLDPTIRLVRLPSNRRLLLSDTVGFIRDLPAALVEAFRATLEEVTEAALLIHVVDAASPHAGRQIAQVESVLNGLGTAETPKLLVLNKMDLVTETAGQGVVTCSRLAGGRKAVGVSAAEGTGLDELLAAVDEMLPGQAMVRARFRFPASGGDLLHMLHEFGRVWEVSYQETDCVVDAEAPQALAERLARYQTRP